MVHPEEKTKVPMPVTEEIEEKLGVVSCLWERNRVACVPGGGKEHGAAVQDSRFQEAQCPPTVLSEGGGHHVPAWWKGHSNLWEAS